MRVGEDGGGYGEDIEAAVKSNGGAGSDGGGLTESDVSDGTRTGKDA